MTGQDSDRGRKRKAADRGRADPPKRQSSSTHRPDSTSAPASDMRLRLDRGLEAKRLADANRAKGRDAERRDILAGARGKAPSGENRADQRSQEETFGALPNLPEQGMTSREPIPTPSFRLLETESQVVADKGELSLPKDPASSEVVLAAAEEGPALDTGKAAEAGGDHPSVGENEEDPGNVFDSSSARGDFLQFRYVGPDCLGNDKAACSELIYSIRGSGDPYPDLKNLAEKEGYERFARLQVRALVAANEVVANYDDALTKAGKEAEDRKDEAAWLRSQLSEAEKEREESARLRAQVERLKNRLRYLKEIAVPSGKVTQIRGILRNLEFLRDKKNVDVPRTITDRMARDLEKYKEEVKAIAEVGLDDEDLL